jgi:hypothetical protein
MKLRVFLALVMLLCMSSFSSIGQDVPEELINIWEYYGTDETQILSIFSDGSFVFYQEERSESDVTDEDCERSVETSRGTIDAGRSEITLIQESSYSIEFPACGLRVDGEVDDERTDELELSFEYDEDANQLILDDVEFNGRFSGVELESVAFDDDDMPAEFVGSWVTDFSVEDMTLTSLLQLNEDGSYFREYTFITEDSELISRDSGEASLNDLILELEQDESVLVMDGEEFPVDTADEQNVVWLAVEDGRMSIYINGLVSYLEGGGTASATEEPSGVVSFEEDFEENRFGWEEGEGDGYVSEFNDGVYIMEFSDDADTTGWIVGPGFTDWDLAPQFEGSYVFQFDFRGECDEVCGVGMAVGLEEQYEGGVTMYYWPLDNRDGFFRLYDRDNDEVLDEGEPFDRIDIFDEEWHTLRLEVSEDNLEFFIDGESIYEYDDGEMDVEGTIGFVMVRDSTDFEFSVEFDNVIVSTEE